MTYLKLWLFLALSCAAAVCGENAAAIKEFGIARTAPINSGFVFIDYKYIPPPYIVERKGLDVFINGMLVRVGSKWPPAPYYDEIVKEDPGDPPPGSSPFDSVPEGKDIRDTYWNKKWRYLSQNYDEKEFARRYAEAYKKCTELVEVVWEEDAGILTYKDKKGNEIPLFMSPWEKKIPPEAKDMLAHSGELKKSIEGNLKTNSLCLFAPSVEYSIDQAEALECLRILTAEFPSEEKIRKLKTRRVIPRDIDVLVAKYDVNSGLLQRIDPSSHPPEIKKEILSKPSIPSDKIENSKRVEEVRSVLVPGIVKTNESKPSYKLVFALLVGALLFLIAAIFKIQMGRKKGAKGVQ